MTLKLSNLDNIIWLLVACFHVALTAISVLRGTWKRFPLFCAHLYVCLSSNVACYYFALTASMTAYAFANFTCEVMVDGLLCLFLWREVYLTTFGPPIALPSGVPLRFLTYTQVFYILSIVVGALLPTAWTYPMIHSLVVLSRALVGMVATFSLVLLIYSARLGISWRLPTLIFTAGVAFTNAIQLLSSYAKHFVRSAAVLWWISSAAYISVLILWFWALLVEAPEVRDVATPEMLRQVSEEMSSTARSARAWLSDSELHS